MSTTIPARSSRQAREAPPVSVLPPGISDESALGVVPDDLKDGGGPGEP